LEEQLVYLLSLSLALQQQRPEPNYQQQLRRQQLQQRPE
jgi:hypothetical protein